jgi:hypothetical protein
MPIDFFKKDCCEGPISDAKFGIIDDQLGAKAHTDFSDESKWHATIKNNNNKKIFFHSIDNCLNIFKDESQDLESTCDAMITFHDGLYLIELKTQSQGGWIQKAKTQLENTIRLLTKAHDISSIKHKKAFACNRKHPNFSVLESAEKKAFFSRTNGFRLDIQAEVVIK